MISKITEKIIRENQVFEQKKKKPGLSANRPANKWALAAQISRTCKCKRGLLLKDRCKNLYASRFHTIFLLHLGTNLKAEEKSL